LVMANGVRFKISVNNSTDIGRVQN
jgi:hypothetical protein